MQYIYLKKGSIWETDVKAHYCMSAEDQFICFQAKLFPASVKEALEF